MLSASGEVSVCPKHELSFTCSTNLDVLEWNITVGMLPSRRQLVTDISRFDSPLMIKHHAFNTTRNSTDGSRPIVSISAIANVSRDLNGTRVSCTDVGGPQSESSTLITTISVITQEFGNSF